ncbi:MAG: hypothetical protein QOH02_512, partial [Gaiellaceae bacterium]|nr:hypothetical protein [Gaiellaceae bacterium]
RGRHGRLSRSRLEELEASGLDARSGELLTVLVWLVVAEVEIDDAERKAGLRRSLLVLAAGGDPHRELDHDAVAVERLATELDTPGRRAALAAALKALAGDAAGLPVVSESLATLLAEPDLAWRTYALALLADELADE